MFELLILIVSLASSFTLAKDAVTSTPPLLFIGLRMILAGFLFLTFVKIKYPNAFTIQKKHYPWFLAISFFHIYLAFCAEFFGIQYLSSAKVCLLFNLSPLITALFSYFFFKERITYKKLIGLLIGFFAFIPLLLESSSLEISLTSFGFISIAEGAVLLAVVAGCIGWILMKKIIHEFNYSYILINGIAMLIGGIGALCTSLMIEQWPPIIPLFSSWNFLRPLILLIIVGNIICYNLYAHFLQRYSATIIAFFSSLTPLFAALLGWFFLHEEITTTFFITLILVIFGLYIFYQEELQQVSVISKK